MAPRTHNKLFFYKGSIIRGPSGDLLACRLPAPLAFQQRFPRATPSYPESSADRNFRTETLLVRRPGQRAPRGCFSGAQTSSYPDSSALNIAGSSPWVTRSTGMLFGRPKSTIYFCPYEDCAARVKKVRGVVVDIKHVLGELSVNSGDLRAHDIPTVAIDVEQPGRFMKILAFAAWGHANKISAMAHEHESDAIV